MMNNTWVPTETAAELCGVHPRTMRRRAGEFKTKEYSPGKGNPGYLFCVDSLPPAAQERAKKVKTSKRSKALVRELKDCTEKQRAIAFERFELLQRWERYAADQRASQAAVVDDFVQDLGGKPSRGTLYKWRAAHKEHGMKGLAPDWKNPRQAFEPVLFSPEAQKWVSDYWLHPNLPSMKLAYNRLMRKALAVGWAVPSYTTVKKYLNSIPSDVVSKHRRGKKYFEHTVLPAINRDPRDLEPLQIVESDHHQVDVACKFPDGRIGFPWLTAWMDVRTRKIVSWVLVSTPNSDSINISFRQLVLKYGIPDNVHLDNGRDYKSRVFTGDGRKNWAWGKKVEVRHNKPVFEGIYADLGVNILWAQPYNAKSKMIERYFKTFRTEFSVDFDSYRGKNVQERPEGLQDKINAGDVISYEELKEAIHKYIDHEYNEQRQHRGLGMENNTPNQVYYALSKKRRTVHEDELMLLCSSYSKPKKVRDDGIQAFQGAWYWSEEIITKYKGKMIKFRYAEDDLSKIYVFNYEGEFLGIANLWSNAPWLAHDEEYQRQMRRKKAVRESVKDWETGNLPKKRLTAKDRIAMHMADSDFEEPEVEMGIITTKYAPIIAAQELEKEQMIEQEAADDAFRQLHDYTPDTGDIDSLILDLGGI